MTAEPLIRARGLKMHFRRRADMPGGSRLLRAVDGVDLDIHEGETVGLVGESGCGKSTLCRLLLWLVEPTDGEVMFDGMSLRTLDRSEMKAARREMQFIFQDLQGSLDPRMRIRRVVGEGPDVHKIGTRAERDQMVVDVLEKVGLTRDVMQRYAHEFSGGQRQRIGIARALVMRPRLVVADEPVSALDVSIQAQILNQLIELKRDFNLTMVFVTHDLAAVGHVSDRVAVMYLGKLVEIAPTDVLFNAPEHPYTQALLSAVPEIESEDASPATPQVLRGELPSALDPPSGCHFRTRCPMAQSVCAEVEPEMRMIGDGHRVACHFVGSGSEAV